MDDLEAVRRLSGIELFNQGWRQGTLFTAPLACFTYNKLSTVEANLQIIRDDRITKPGEKFVLITQDCDIVAAENDEPYVEALLCKVDKAKFVGKISPKSARWFVVDHDKRLVAYAKYRTQFEKQVLKTLMPEAWPKGPKQLDEFARWLARRYDRLSIPDAIYEAFQRPIDERLARLSKEYPDVFAIFNRVVGDIRVNLPESEQPPFNLQLILLVGSDGLGEEETNAIDFFNEVVQSSLDTTLVNLEPTRIVTEEEIPLKEFYASRPIYVGDYTYHGEEIEGAIPHGRN